MKTSKFLSPVAAAMIAIGSNASTLAQQVQPLAQPNVTTSRVGGTGTPGEGAPTTTEAVNLRIFSDKGTNCVTAEYLGNDKEGNVLVLLANFGTNALPDSVRTSSMGKLTHNRHINLDRVGGNPNPVNGGDTNVVSIPGGTDGLGTTLRTTPWYIFNFEDLTKTNKVVVSDPNKTFFPQDNGALTFVMALKANAKELQAALEESAAALAEQQKQQNAAMPVNQ